MNNDEYIASLAYNAIEENLKHNIWCCSLDVKDIGDLNITNIFWEDVMRAWCEYNSPKSKQLKPAQQMLWYNSRIKINGRTVFWKTPYKNGLIKVSDLFANG